MLSKLSLILFLAAVSLCSLANEYEVVEQNGRFGLKNTSTNEWSVKPIFEAIGWSNGTFNIEEGLVGAKLNEKWALYTVNGAKTTQHLYSEIVPFVRGTFIASKRDKYSIRVKYGLINNKGKTVIPFENDRLNSFNGKLIASRTTGNFVKSGLINYQGKVLLPFDYVSIEPISTYRLEVKNSELKAALFSIEGEVLSEFDYEKIRPYKVGYFEVTYMGRKGLIDDKGDLIIPPLYKKFELSKGTAKGLPFTQWDAYQNSKFKKSSFFDDFFELSDSRFAINSGNTTAIIGDNEQYFYINENQQIIDSQGGLAIIKDLDKGFQGVVTREGKFLLNINYDSIYFSSEYMAASIDKLGSSDWTIFSLEGKQINASSYESIIPYSNKFKATRKGKSGLLNKFGEEISPFLYDEIEEEKNGLSVVKYQNRKGVIDQTGLWIITPYNDSIHIDKRRIYVEQGSQFKLFEFNGHLSFSTYDTLMLFSRGYALKSTDGLSLYNFRNERLLEPSYDSISQVNDNLYALYRNNRIFFYRPSDGADFELDPEISRVLKYSEGYVKIMKDGQYGFVDESGQLRIANRYQQAKNFSEGFAAVKLIGNWGYIDKAENLVIQPSFEEAQPFYNKLAVVKQGNYYGLIAPNTELVLNTVYDDITRFEDYMIIESQGLLGLVDTNGNLIKDCQYDEITPLAKKVFLVRKDEKFGIIDSMGADLVPINYAKIKMYGSRFYGALSEDREPIRLLK